VAGAISRKLGEMAADCRALQAETKHLPGQRRCQVIQDTFFNALNHLALASVDLAITSPPYLNNYHYVRNTRPHLFWLRFIESSTDLRVIEHESFGKFWQTVRDGERIDLAFELFELERVLNDIRGKNPDRGIYG